MGERGVLPASRNWYWWIGPESKVVHLCRDCKHLRNVNRYWPLDSGNQRPPGRRECVACSHRRFLDE